MTAIDEKARKKFESDWLNGKSSSIREYLPDRRDETYIDTLEELVCIDLEFRWKPRTEQRADSDCTFPMDEAVVPTRVEDYLREFPELNRDNILQRLVEQEIYVRIHAGYLVEASEYRSRFPGVAVDESLFSNADDGKTKIDSQSQSNGSMVCLPQQFGSYVLTRLMGRGGMGSVYRARQPAAGREVAIKIADVATLGPINRSLLCQRFEKEAHAAAALRHDHIVPIFDVGVIDQQPYIAMQLVEGGDLGTMSKAQPLDPKRAAGYLLGVTRAIADAHAKGLLHRDIKPQNILVDATTDRAMLTDFGLARFSSEDSGLTQAGQVLGTPSFMPPEQISDSSGVDAKADIYSLGATLYQLLTGRPPFKAATVQETLRQVILADPVPPRRINPDVDQDLDTICIKCLEKEPRARYASAEDLARDLNLYLQDMPIVARPTGPATRLRKWARRNKMLAMASSLAVLGLFATLVVSLTGWSVNRRMFREIEQKNAKLESQQAELKEQYDVVASKNKLVSSTSEVLRDGFYEQYVQIMDDPLLTIPGLEPLRQQFLSRSLSYFEQLIDLYGNEVDMRGERAAALAAIGNMTFDLYPSDPSVELKLQAAMAALEELPAELRNTPKLLQAESDILNGLGQLAAKQNKLQIALERFAACEKTRRDWTALAPQDLEAHRKLANAIMNQGLVLRSLANQAIREGNPSEGDQYLGMAEGKLFDAQLQRKQLFETGDIKLRRDYAQAEFNLAFLELQHNDLGQAQLRLQEANRLLGELASELATDARLWESYARSRIHLAEVMQDSEPSDQAAAAQLIHSALSDLTALFNLGDQNPFYRLRILSHFQRGIDALVAIDNLAMAEDFVQNITPMLDETLSVWEQSSADPLPEQAVTVQLHHAKHLALLSAGFNDADAVEQVRKAITAFEQQADVVSEDPLLTHDLVVLRQVLDSLSAE